MASRLLIVEDDGELAAQIAEQMDRHGYECRIAGDGRDALRLVSEEVFDAIILDRMLPGIDGLSVLQCLRQASVVVPVLMLTALGQSSQKIEGLDAGADDYVVKPVDPEEINARIKALIRARQWKDTASEQTLEAGDIIVSPTRFIAWRNGKALKLQNIEFKILMVLARNADSVVTRAMLLEQVWHYDFEPGTNLVEAHIRRLRLKLAEYGGDDPIRTVRGVGYVLRG